MNVSILCGAEQSVDELHEKPYDDQKTKQITEHPQKQQAAELFFAKSLKTELESLDYRRLVLIQ